MRIPKVYVSLIAEKSTGELNLHFMLKSNKDDVINSLIKVLGPTGKTYRLVKIWEISMQDYFIKIFPFFKAKL